MQGLKEAGGKITGVWTRLTTYKAGRLDEFSKSDEVHGWGRKVNVGAICEEGYYRVPGEVLLVYEAAITPETT